MIKGAHMSRFILLSAALHLGLLAALGYSAVRPQFLPSALSVTLNRASDTAATPSHLRGTPKPSLASNAHTTRKELNRAARPAPSKPIAPQKRQSILPQEAETNDQTDKPHPKLIPQEQGTPTVARQLPDPQPQRIDTVALTYRLQGQLRNALAPYFTYPLLARRNGWQGQVQVGLRVEADGRLSHVRIAHSSGYGLLDSAALATLNRIQALPKAAGWLDGQHFDMVLPIEYRLIDGQS